MTLDNDHHLDNIPDDLIRDTNAADVTNSQERLLNIGDCRDAPSNNINSYTLPDQVPPIRTFVFVDLETTGLDDPRITELSMVAVSRDNLIEMDTRHKKVKSSSSKKRNVQPPTNENGQAAAKQRGVLSVKRRLFSDDQTVTKHPRIGHDMTARHLLQTAKPQANGLTNSTDASTSNVKLSTNCADASTNTYLHYSARNTIRRMIYRVPAIPRITFRHTKFFNPRRLIYPVTEFITGLNNLMLEHVPLLSKEYCNSFKEFLNLPKPICLIAHNGDRFDFPTIIAEFIYATNCQFDCEDILCADSLVALRLLDKVEVMDEIQKATTDVQNNWDWFFDVDSTDEINSAAAIVGNASIPDPSYSRAGSSTPERAQRNAMEEEVRECFKTPVRHMMTLRGRVSINTPETPSSQAIDGIPASMESSLLSSTLDTPPSTPQRVRNSGIEPLPSTSNFETPTNREREFPVADLNVSNTKTNPERSNDSRILSQPQTSKKFQYWSSNRRNKPPSLVSYPPMCSFKSKIHLTINHNANAEYNLGLNYKAHPFSQPVLYERLFGRNYAAHRADTDCEALLEICGHYGEEFVETADVLRRPLRCVAPKWLKNIEYPTFRRYWLE